MAIFIVLFLSASIQENLKAKIKFKSYISRTTIVARSDFLTFGYSLVIIDPSKQDSLDILIRV